MKRLIETSYLLVVAILWICLSFFLLFDHYIMYSYIMICAAFGWSVNIYFGYQ